MYRIVWTYTVEQPRARAFEKAYGPEGDLAALFGRAEGFLGTALFRDTGREDRYLTVDYWTTEPAWRAFLRDFPAQHEALETHLAALTVAQNRVAAVSG